MQRPCSWREFGMSDDSKVPRKTGTLRAGEAVVSKGQGLEGQVKEAG